MKSPRGHAGTVLLTTAIAALGFFIYFGRAHWGISANDEGYILELAYRVSQGAIPYRDFYTLYPPNIYYGLSWAFQLFGPSLLISRILVALVKTSILVLCYVIARRLLPPASALLAPILVWLVDLTAGLSLIPYAALVAEFFILMSWWLLTLERRNPVGPLLAGGCAVLAFTFKQPVGALGTLACLVWLAKPLWKYRPLFKLIPLLAMGLVVFPFLPNLQFAHLPFIIPALLSVIAIARSGSEAVPSKATSRLMHFLLGGTAMTVVWCIPAVYEIGVDHLWRGLLVNPIMDASLRFETSSMWEWMLGAELILFLYGCAFLLAFGFLIIPARLQHRRPLQLGVVLAGFLIATLYPWPGSVRASWISAPFMILLVWGISQFKARIFRLPRFPRLAVAAVLVLGFVGTLAIPGLRHQTRAVISRSTSVLHASLSYYFRLEASRSNPKWNQIDRARGIWDESSKAHSLMELVSWVQQHVSEDEVVVTYPRGGMIYFLANRPNPLYYAMVGLEASLARPAGPRFAEMIFGKADWLILAEAQPLPRSLDPLMEGRFHPVFQTDSYTVYRKREPGIETR